MNPLDPESEHPMTTPSPADAELTRVSRAATNEAQSAAHELTRISGREPNGLLSDAFTCGWMAGLHTPPLDPAMVSALARHHAERSDSLTSRLTALQARVKELEAENADVNGLPNCLVLVSGDWTNFELMRFTGDTLIAALKNAVDARDAAQPEQENQK